MSKTRSFSGRITGSSHDQGGKSGPRKLPERWNRSHSQDGMTVTLAFSAATLELEDSGTVSSQFWEKTATRNFISSPTWTTHFWSKPQTSLPLRSLLWSSWKLCPKSRAKPETRREAWGLRIGGSNAGGRQRELPTRWQREALGLRLSLQQRDPSV